MSLTKLFLGGNDDAIYKLFLPRESLVSDIPAGNGNIEELFYGAAAVQYLVLVWPRGREGAAAVKYLVPVWPHGRESAAAVQYQVIIPRSCSREDAAAV